MFTLEALSTVNLNEPLYMCFVGEINSTVYVSPGITFVNLINPVVISRSITPSGVSTINLPPEYLVS